MDAVPVDLILGGELSSLFSVSPSKMCEFVLQIKHVNIFFAFAMAVQVLKCHYLM